MLANGFGPISRLYMVMAAAVTSGNYPKSVKLHSSKFVRSRVIALGLYPMFYKPPHAFRLKLSSSSCFFCIPQPLLVNNFKRMTWSIRSSVDSSGLDPSPTNGTTGTTRLIRAIQAIQTKLGGKIRELRRGFLFKVLFFLVGFYCATAYATVIGQTGDWDILSAAFAVVVVEGIGALMYKASLPLLMKTRSLITMFNYWKAGLSMGLFLDSFKYEFNDIFGFSSPFNFEFDAFSMFL
ncbi:ycf20-like protein isoform X1 [Prunus dulcis]|nr:ycf20-like protein isoform X1 [Prunus dulcis]